MNGQTNETQWYIARDGKQHGPLTDIEMRTFVAHNYLRPSDLIWRPGMAEWQLAPTLFPAVFPNNPVAATPAQSSSGIASATPERAPANTVAPTTPTPATASPTPRTYSDAAPASTTSPERSMAKRLAIAASAITLIGGGAFALATYREPLIRFVSGSGDSTLVATDTAPTVEAPTIEAPATPAGAATDAPASTASPPSPGVETATVTPPDPPTFDASNQPSHLASPGSSPNSSTASTEVAAAAFDPAASVVVPTAGLAPPSIVGSTIDVRLQKIPAWTIIKKDYPDWYVTNIAAAEQLVTEQKPPTEVSTHIAQSLVALRRQNAEKALSASSEKLRRIAVAFLENLKSLRSQSVTACYGFISKGETSPSVVQLVDTPDGATAFHGQIGAIFEAIAEGSKSPQQHPPAVKSDYDLLIKELGKLGWKEEDLQVFSNPRLLAKREPERVCTMVQEWFVAHLAVPDKAARDRLLYETLKPVISG